MHYRANRVDRMAVHFEQFLKLAPEAAGSGPRCLSIMRTRSKLARTERRNVRTLNVPTLVPTPQETLTGDGGLDLARWKLGVGRWEFD